MSIDVSAKVLIAAAGGVAALMFASPAAAEPEASPAPVPAPAVVPAPAPAVVPPPAPVAPVVPAPVVPEPAAPTSDTVAAPAAGVPHLPSPDAPPPGSTMDPSVMTGGESPNVSYLRDLWQAVQNQEISGKEALLLGISQRNLNTPIPQQAPGPNVPVTSGGSDAVPPAPPVQPVTPAPAP